MSDFIAGKGTIFKPVGKVNVPGGKTDGSRIVGWRYSSEGWPGLDILPADPGAYQKDFGRMIKLMQDSEKQLRRVTSLVDISAVHVLTETNTTLERKLKNESMIAQLDALADQCRRMANQLRDFA